LEHGLTCKKHLTRLGSQQDPDHNKRTTRNLQLQFLLELHSRLLENVEMSKQGELLKHEGEMQLECVQKKIHTPISPTHKLWGMPENRKKELKLEKIYCENVILHNANDMFQNCPKRNRCLDTSYSKHPPFGVYFNIIYLNGTIELQQKTNL
jgi:hypothetical protein